MAAYWNATSPARRVPLIATQQDLPTAPVRAELADAEQVLTLREAASAWLAGRWHPTLGAR